MFRFRIISQLGAGGCGEAFRAWDSQQGLPVVLKRPLAKHLHRPDILERFDREIARLLECDHPHIVPIIAHGHDPDGLPYLAMRFLPAGSLADRKKPQPLSFLHHWLPAVAAALDYVHARGVVHRDVKPANIFFDTETVAYLGDFGIAKVIDEDLARESEQSLTATGGEIGTYPYMGPEFFGQPRVLSGAYDQYALAVSVYEMICGRRPFTGDSVQVIAAHVTQDPPDIRQFQADVPETICHALSRALAKKPLDRFSTCSCFAQAVLQDVPLTTLDEAYKRFLCPACHKLVRVPTEFGGRSCRCPDCTAVLRVSPNCDALWRRDEDPTDIGGAQVDRRYRPPSVIRNSIGMTLKLIPAGTFMMGSHQGEAAEGPVHKVRISNAFYLGETAVTQDQWVQVMDDNPSTHKDPSRPVETISWNEAVVFCKRLSNRPEEKVAGRVYRLPTEAEWEHACRAGTTTSFSFGDDHTRLVEYAWFNLEELTKGWLGAEDDDDEDASAFLAVYGCTETNAVGKKRPNPWGLFDMHGNVSEWCADWYGEYPSEEVTNPSGPVKGNEKVSRGGAWISTAQRCSSASRQHLPPNSRFPVTGFRIACSCAAEERRSPRPHPGQLSGEGSAADLPQAGMRTERDSIAPSPSLRKECHGGSESNEASAGASRIRVKSPLKPNSYFRGDARSPTERAKEEPHWTARLRAVDIFIGLPLAGILATLGYQTLRFCGMSHEQIQGSRAIGWIGCLVYVFLVWPLCRRVLISK